VGEPESGSDWEPKGAKTAESRGLGFSPMHRGVRVGFQLLETLFDKGIFRISQRSGIQPLGKEEWEELQALRSQNAILKPGRGQHSKYPPCAFTEHGALMAANILNSPRAVAMSVYVIRAFVKMREDLAANAAILKRLAEIDKTLLLHDGALRDIYQKLRPLLEPPPPPPKPEIGFHVKEDSLPYRVRRKLART
jgi:hypothetical protein